jgi:hypothetical protein
VRYEELCRDPVGTLQSTAEFCELDWSPEFAAVVSSFSFENRNNKWREHLGEAQQRTLTECLRGTLERYGYA